MDLDDINNILSQLGYSSLSDYQKDHFLQVTGVPDSATLRSLSSVRYCQLPERFVLDASNPAKWKNLPVVWGFSTQFQLPGFSMEAATECFMWAFRQWELVCGIQFKFTESRNDDKDITITSGRIDNPGNTLAWSEMPTSSNHNSPLTQKFDAAEPFVFSSNPPPNRIDLGAVACHEIGHAIGIPHAPANTRNLMAPIYSPVIRTPQVGDIEAAKSRYGIPIDQSVPNPPNGGETPLNPYTPIPYDPNHPEKKIFPSPLALPVLTGYTWIAVPNAFIPPTK